MVKKPVDKANTGMEKQWKLRDNYQD